jgi:hypothetical protein
MIAEAACCVCWLGVLSCCAFAVGVLTFEIVDSVSCFG